MKAVIVESKGGPAMIVNDRPEPRLRSRGYLLVRTKAVALNPADVAVLDYAMAPEGCLLGFDYAGIVEKVGPGVIRDFKVGDRVCGPSRAGDPFDKEAGTFAEAICVKADLAIKIPKGMTFEEACTTGVIVVTTGRCLYQKFNLPWPIGDKVKPKPQGKILIYGGSSSMGTVLIQLAKLSGYEVITTCSPADFSLVRSSGADHVFDYNDPACTQEINNITGGNLKLCVDCISTDAAATLCAEALSPGAKCSNILLAKCPRDDVESLTTLDYSSLGEEWEQFGIVNSASKEDFEHSKSFAELAEELLNDAKIRPHPIEKREGGLDAILQGPQDLRAKRVSGKELVFTL